jgi:hypothetical protein
MLALFCIILASLALPFKANVWLEAENVVLRYQVMVLRRQVRGRVHLTNLDRLFLVDSVDLVGKLMNRPGFAGGCLV